MVFVDTLSKEKDREDTELLRKVCPSDEEESDEDTDEEDDEEDDDADEVSRSPRSAARRGRGAPDEGESVHYKGARYPSLCCHKKSYNLKDASFGRLANHGDAVWSAGKFILSIATLATRVGRRIDAFY